MAEDANTCDLITAAAQIALFTKYASVVMGEC